MKQAEAGLTLIEVLLVLSILVIISTWTYDGITMLYYTCREQLLQQQILHVIRCAQQEAYTRHTPIALCASSNQKNCSGQWQDGQILFVNRYRDGVMGDYENIVAIFNGLSIKHGRIHCRSFPYYRDFLLFLPHDFKTDNSLFWFCRMREQKPAWAIALAKSGRARVIYPDKNGVIVTSHSDTLTC